MLGQSFPGFPKNQDQMKNVSTFERDFRNGSSLGHNIFGLDNNTSSPWCPFVILTNFELLHQLLFSGETHPVLCFSVKLVGFST